MARTDPIALASNLAATWQRRSDGAPVLVTGWALGGSRFPLVGNPGRVSLGHLRAGARTNEADSIPAAVGVVTEGAGPEYAGQPVKEGTHLGGSCVVNASKSRVQSAHVVAGPHEFNATIRVGTPVFEQEGSNRPRAREVGPPRVGMEDVGSL